MNVLETVDRAKTQLQEHGRVSLRMLKREVELDADALDELVEGGWWTYSGWQCSTVRFSWKVVDS